MGAKHYTAFISYSHNDEAFAKRLHRRLEAYKPPKHLIQSQGKYGPVPPNLKPIFRDQDELSVDGNLSRAIQTALKKSSSLIILCSPAAVASRWVNEEIITFKRLAKARGEEARIYPVLSLWSLSRQICERQARRCDWPYLNYKPPYWA